MSEEIKFTWDMTSYCNFKCDYCFFSQTGWENLKAKQGRDRTPEEIEEAWKYIFDKYGSCYISITGGEPFLYPEFTEIIFRILKYHKLHITTNLSMPLEDFIQKISPEKVEF